MTESVIRWSDIDTGRIDQKSSYSGIYRYQRKTGEQALSAFWQSRESNIETLLEKSRREPERTAGERIDSIRMISLRQLDSLQYWNLGEYLESVRNEARWFYDTAVYEDQDGEYLGASGFLPEAVSCAIRGMDRKIITKEERQQLIAKMRTHFPEGFEEVVSFIITNSCKSTWPHVTDWLECMVKELNSEQIYEIVRWLVRYDAFAQGQKSHFNLGEYKFLEQVADRLTEEEWELLMPTIERMYANPHFYRSNDPFSGKALRYMPLAHCVRMLEKIGNWQAGEEGRMKRDLVCEICMDLRSERGEEIKSQLHRLIGRCQETDPCGLYQELKQLIEIENLLERSEPEMDEIGRVVDEALEKLKMANLSGYDSRLLNEMGEKITNQNWRAAPEEQVLDVIGRLLGFLKEHAENLSAMYFYNLCAILNSFTRMGTPREKREIVCFFIREYILSSPNLKVESMGFPDGPLNTCHINMGGKRQREMGILSVLIYGVTEIPEEYQQDSILWGLSCLALPGDKGRLDFDAVLLFTYFYFNGKETVRGTAFSGLMYIRGRLEAGGKGSKDRMAHVLRALKNLEKIDEWFDGRKFLELAAGDAAYRELFFDPVQNLIVS